MSRLGVGLASALLCLALAASAGAQSTGNGLYEPFPSGASKARAKRFVNDLRPQSRAVSEAELDRGSFAGTVLTAVPPAGGASDRAGAAAAPGGALGWAVALLVLSLCAAPVLWTARRRG
ncbi:MAG: hypothetical protein WKF96_06295 [Solirubrobacteraceae bacterium]